MRALSPIAAAAVLLLTSACAESPQELAKAGRKPLNEAELTKLHSTPLTMNGRSPNGNVWTVRRYPNGGQNMEWSNPSVSGSDSGTYYVKGDQLCSSWRSSGTECGTVYQTGLNAYQIYGPNGSVTSTYTIAR
jgi:hypothetical protein